MEEMDNKEIGAFNIQAIINNITYLMEKFEELEERIRRIEYTLDNYIEFKDKYD